MAPMMWMARCHKRLSLPGTGPLRVEMPQFLYKYHPKILDRWLIFIDSYEMSLSDPSSYPANFFQILIGDWVIFSNYLTNEEVITCE
jgi:hypothetical protein